MFSIVSIFLIASVVYRRSTSEKKLKQTDGTNLLPTGKFADVGRIKENLDKHGRLSPSRRRRGHRHDNPIVSYCHSVFINSRLFVVLHQFLFLSVE